MNLTPWKKQNVVSDPVVDFFDNDPFFRSFFPSLDSASFQRPWLPALDVNEHEDRYEIQADLPGLKKEDISLNYDNGVLSITGERKVENKESGKGFRRLERSYGQFNRSVHLGGNVDNAKIDAQYKDGVLKIIVPKSEQGRAKAIQIK